MFPQLGEGDYVRRLVTFSEDKRHERPGRSFDVVTKDVCRVCNSGWMSDLEAQAQPILTPMVLGEARVLNATDQHLLATWATKTALTMQGANIGGERMLSSEQYRWFGEHRAPLPSSHVWLCHWRARPEQPLVIHQWGMTVQKLGEPEPKEGDALNGFGIVFTIGYVAFWLAGYELPGAPRTRASSDDTHLLIWPALGPTVRWPPPQMLETEDQLEALARRLPAGTQVLGMPEL